MNGKRRVWVVAFLASLMLLPSGSRALLSANPGEPQRGTGVDAQIRFMTQVQSRFEREILRLPGVMGMGIGMKGQVPAFVILADEKADMPSIPTSIEGYPVEVKVTGKVVVHNGGTGCVPCHANQESLPTPMGQSTSDDQSCYSCTLGFIACRGSVRGYVTNHHCNADSNFCESSGAFNHYERSRGDNGCSLGQQIGTTNFVAPFGLVDAAFIASNSSRTQISIKDIGAPSNTPGSAFAGDCIKKSGRTTGLTFARVIITNATVNVSGYCAGTQQFTQQIVYQADGSCGTGPISMPGDSGSPVLNSNNQIVGLNFAGGGSGPDNIGVANTVQNVLSELGLTLGECPAQPPPPPPPPPSSCPFSTAVAGTPQEELTLATLYNFRDQVLSRTAQGQQYIQLYYDNSAEATTLLMRNWRLLSQARQLISRYTPAVRSMVEAKPVIVSQRDVDEVDQFLNGVSSLGVSAKMQSAIDRIRRDLRSSAIQVQFGVNIGR